MKLVKFKGDYYLVKKTPSNTQDVAEKLITILGGREIIACSKQLEKLPLLDFHLIEQMINCDGECARYECVCDKNKKKEFTLEQMRECFCHAKQPHVTSFERLIEGYIKTEWDVLVEMEWKPVDNYCPECGEGGLQKEDKKPCDNVCRNNKIKISRNGYINITKIF